jgi:plastocyanin
LKRRALASAAGLAVTSAVLALVALPSASKPTKPLHMPSAAAANAAFLSGLLSSTSAAPAVANAATPSGAVQVSIQNYAFSPATLTVGVGTTVTWTNKDTAPHTVTVSSGPQMFASPTLQTGDTYTFTFTTPGTYSYYCAVHPSMTASVVVTGSPTTTPVTTTPTTPTTSSSMPMPPTGNSACAVSSGLQTLLTHINSAHLDESPGQQVNDILNLDQYVGNHLVLVQRILEPLTGGGLTTAISSLLQTFLTHVNSAHLDESPGQQVNDILNVNTYIGNHLSLVQHMLSSSEALAC